jgi:hypothetical protein
MNNGNEQMQIEFHHKANAMFFSVYGTFERAVSNVSRRNEEYRFQQLKRQHAATLEQELQLIAKDILVSYKNDKQTNEMNRMLNQFIKNYLHRFIQKINDL